MLDFRKTNILFSVAFVLLLLIDRSYDIHWSLYLLLILGFFTVQFYGCYFINSGFHIKAFCKKQITEKKIAITFDDGPDKITTSKVLDALKEFQSPAAFFCIGKKIEGSENVIMRMNEEGHILGNHSFSHAFWFDLFSVQRMTKELIETGSKIQSIIGSQPQFFRPPYGVTNPNLRKAVRNLNFQTIGWSFRSLDTVLKDDEKILKRVIDKIKPGSVLLFHDTIPGTDAMLRKLLIWLKENKYKVVRVDEMFNLKAYA